MTNIDCGLNTVFVVLFSELKLLEFQANHFGHITEKEGTRITNVSLLNMNVEQRMIGDKIPKQTLNHFLRSVSISGLNNFSGSEEQAH